MLLTEYKDKPVNGRYYLLRVVGNVNHIVRCKPERNWRSGDMTNISCTVYNSDTDRVSDKACYLTKGGRLYMKTHRDGRLFLDDFKVNDSNLTLIDKREEQRRCNRCGKPLDIWDIQEDFSMHKNLGYGTKNDGSVLDLKLCCDCIDNLIDECVISPVIDNT